MSSVRLRSLAAVLAATVASLVPAAALAGVVVSSSGPSASSYPVGRQIGDNEPFVLKVDDTITVLDSNGTRVFSGAGTFTLSAHEGPSKAGAFAILTRQRAAQRMRTGAVRAGDEGGPVSSPNLWYVDVRTSGAMCLASPDEVRLWRPTTEGEASYTIKAAGADATAEATFHDGEMLAPWDDSALPVSDGASFVLSRPGGEDRTITFKVLDSVPDQADALAEKLIANGCTTQLKVLSSAMKVAEE
jgi:hypothetical protein